MQSAALQRRCSSASSSSSGRSAVPRRPALARPAQLAWRRPAIEEKRETTETESSPADLLSTEDRLSQLRQLKTEAPPPKGSSNVIQGALDEAQLITWPKPGKALLDTVLVLAIVAGTGAALFGVNVLLTDAFNWWYSH